jgi:lambda family phage portal protein
MRSFEMPRRAGLSERLRSAVADAFGGPQAVRIGHIRGAPQAQAAATPAPPMRIRANYQGAAGGRLLGDFAAPIGHPDTAIRYALPNLRARSRDLWRNNSYVAGFANSLRDNVIGSEGIQLQAQIRKADGKLALPTCRKIEDGWRQWGEAGTATIDGMTSWLDVEWLCIESVARDGEVFVRERPGADNRFGYTVELIAADLLDETYDVPLNAAGVEIRMGVEFDTATGKRLGYWFWPRHPDSRYGGGRGQKRVWVAASEIIHLFVQQYVGQTRGVPWLAPVIADLWMFAGLTEAELTAARLEACKMGFLVNKSDAAIQSYTDQQALVNPTGDGEREPISIDVAPALFSELPPGVEFQQFDPSHPNGNIGNFSKLILRGIARGIGISYGTLTGDLSEANYSSMRAGLLPERDRWRTVQKWFWTRLHSRVYRGWVRMAVLTPSLRVDSRLASDYYAVTWKGRGWRPVDPLKDRQADLLAWQMRVKPLADIAADEGRDLEEVFAQIAYEQELAAEMGIVLPAPLDAAGATGPGQPDDEQPQAEPSAQRASLRVA